MVLHPCELLKMTSKSLRPSIDCGFGSRIARNEEIHNIHSDEERLKIIKNGVDVVPTKNYRTKKTLIFRIP